MDAVAQGMGGLDSVFAIAGVAAYGTVRQADETSFDRVLMKEQRRVFITASR